MTHLDRTTTAATVRLRAWLRTHLHRASTESGEGVISAAIVVLIMALLGAAMWATFNTLWGETEGTIESEIRSIAN